MATRKTKLCIDLKWPELQSKVMADRSEMARNAIESEFRTSKMGAGGHFVKIKKKFRIDLKWPVIGRRQPFCKKKSQK